MPKKRIFTFAVCTMVTAAAFSFVNTEQLGAVQSRRVDVNVNTSQDRKVISPYIYGINDTVNLAGGTYTVLKQGGTEFSTYNWETNYSNPGEINHSTNEGVMGGRYYVDSLHPAAAVEGLVNLANENGIDYTVTTLPMLGYAAADMGGPILDGEEAPSERWREVIPRKNAVFPARPDTDDDVVYVDEYVNYLVKRFGKSSETGINAYCLDTDASEWTLNHPYAISELTLSEYIEKTKSTASAVKSVDSDAIILGGSFNSIESLATFRDNPEWKRKYGDYNWFVDYYLDKMKGAEIQSGKRLVDALDICYYPDITLSDGTSILESSSDEANELRIEATRALWDSSYADTSKYKQYYPLLPTLQASINEYYPDTKLSLSEYNFGGGSDFSGGIAEIDILGNFAHEGVYLACLKPSDGNDFSYQQAAINLFTNYDGNGSGFGDIIVRSALSDTRDAGAYAAVDKEGKLCIILVNRNDSVTLEMGVNIDADTEYTAAEVYGFDDYSPNIVKIASYTMINHNSLSYTLRPSSAVVIAFDYLHNEQTTPTDDSQTETATPDTEVTVPPEPVEGTETPDFVESTQSNVIPDEKNETSLKLITILKIGSISFGVLTALMIAYLFLSESDFFKKIKNKN